MTTNDPSADPLKRESFFVVALPFQTVQPMNSIKQEMWEKAKLAMLISNHNQKQYTFTKTIIPTMFSGLELQFLYNLYKIAISP